MDFYDITVQETGIRKKHYDILPNFKVMKSKDLMIRGGAFYSIWDEEKQMWSTDEYDVARLIDKELKLYSDKYVNEHYADTVTVKYMSRFNSNSWLQFKKYLKSVDNNYNQLDSKIIFSNTNVKKSDYASKKLPYPLEEGSIKAYDELMSVLYAPEERQKIEWVIGAIISGDSKKIQKFLVLYGEGGTGKSTVLDIIEKMFDGYCTIFDSKGIASNNNTFAMESLKNNSLIAIQHEGDLSKIEDNSKLNSLIAHETMIMNEKFKSAYPIKFNSFLIMATNKPVKITDSRSGIIRRLIDAHPTGNLIPTKRYDVLTKMMDVVKAYAKHEKETLFEVISLRKGMSIDEKNEANRKMNSNLEKINVLAESYPELRSNENYVTLQKSIVEVEEHLQAARRMFNSNVSIYNQMLVTFPTSIIASSKSLTKKEFFEADANKKEDVKIDL